ncbi:DUF4352 domain-containing protein [Pseudactinotalea terrae]|uniref:DUF4352 domain-containing protein n=1 Tax=Pseudactinotalea terrae TaxID=1743262 RepID=UPI0012E2C2DF|nr:DUF4352 domain-containing protein [Pseudactinotalea terrae]
MRRQFFAAAAAVATMVALGACGSEPGGGTYPTNTVDPNAAAAESTTDPATEEPTTEEPTTEEPTTEEPTEQGPTINAHGNLDKEVGQEAGILDYDGTEHVKFTLTEYAWDMECTNEWAEGPKNGTFLGLHFDVMTTQEFVENDWATEFSMDSFEFGAYRGDTRVNDVDGNSYMCLDDNDQLPRIGPGQHATGWVVLDVPEDVTSVQFISFMTEGGWEWQVPRS